MKTSKERWESRAIRKHERILGLPSGWVGTKTKMISPHGAVITSSRGRCVVRFNNGEPMRYSKTWKSAISMVTRVLGKPAPDAKAPGREAFEEKALSREYGVCKIPAGWWGRWADAHGPSGVRVKAVPYGRSYFGKWLVMRGGRLMGEFKSRTHAYRIALFTVKL